MAHCMRRVFNLNFYTIESALQRRFYNKPRVCNLFKIPVSSLTKMSDHEETAPNKVSGLFYVSSNISLLTT